MRRLPLLAVLLLAALPIQGAQAQTTPAARYRVPQPFTPPKPAAKGPTTPAAPAIELAPVAGTSAPGSAVATTGASADVCRASAARNYYGCLAVGSSDDSCQSDWARQRSACGSLRLRP